MRYDDEFWPTKEVAEEAQSLAAAVRDFVVGKLPPEIVAESRLP